MYIFSLSLRLRQIEKKKSFTTKEQQISYKTYEIIFIYKIKLLINQHEQIRL